MLTDHGLSLGSSLKNDYLSFYGDLFMRFHDGDITSVDESDPMCNCQVAEKEYR